MGVERSEAHTENGAYEKQEHPPGAVPWNGCQTCQNADKVELWNPPKDLLCATQQCHGYGCDQTSDRSLSKVVQKLAFSFCELFAFVTQALPIIAHGHAPPSAAP